MPSPQSPSSSSSTSTILVVKVVGTLTIAGLVVYGAKSLKDAAKDKYRDMKAKVLKGNYRNELIKLNTKICC